MNTTCMYVCTVCMYCMYVQYLLEQFLDFLAEGFSNQKWASKIEIVLYSPSLFVSTNNNNNLVCLSIPYTPYSCTPTVNITYIIFFAVAINQYALGVGMFKCHKNAEQLNKMIYIQANLTNPTSDSGENLSHMTTSMLENVQGTSQTFMTKQEKTSRMVVEALSRVYMSQLNNLEKKQNFRS